MESIFSGLQLLPLLPYSGPLTFTIDDDTVCVICVRMLYNDVVVVVIVVDICQ